MFTVGSRAGHGYVCGQVANVDWARTRTNCGRGRGLIPAPAKLLSWSVYGLNPVKIRTWTGCGRGCGLDGATASRPDKRPDISTLKIQGVRRPPCNPHKLCGHSRIHLRTGHYTNSGMFRHRAETFSEISIALTGRSCTRSETKQVGSGMNGRRRSGAWGRNGR